MKNKQTGEVIEFFEYDGNILDENAVYYIPQWAIDGFNDEMLTVDEESFNLEVATPEGKDLVEVGDYVVFDSKGEYHAFTPEAFHATFE